VKSPIHNPFIFEGPVPRGNFIGRKHEVNLVLDRVSSNTRGSIALVGERRIGKTSLMHYVANPDVVQHWNLDPSRSIFTYLDCGTVPQFSTTRFWQTVLRKLDRSLRQDSSTEVLRDDINKLVRAQEIVTQDIEFLLDDLHAAGFVWVLLLDEFEWLIRTDVENEATTRDLLGGLRGLMNHVPRVLSLIVATRQPLHEICREIRFMGSPFYNSFVYVHLRPFQPEEAESLIQQMLTSTDVRFTSEDRIFLFELAGLHPLLLQTAAFCLFNAKAGGAESTSLDLDAIRDQYAHLVEHQFEDLWRWSQPREKLVLLALALGDRASANWLRDWGYERELLLQRGLTIKIGSKEYTLFSLVFRQWLLDNDYRLVDEPLKRWAKENGYEQWMVEYAYLQPEQKPTPATKKSVNRAAASPVIFISYSHKDRKYKDALLQQLRVLEGAEIVEDVWTDDTITAGEDWEAHINRAIADAQVAIFLISADSLNSPFIRAKEIPELLRRRESEGLLVIPVVARPCAWKTVSWLRSMQVRPIDGKPLSRDGDLHLDEDLALLADEIARLLRKKSRP
jgi:hypothetical protein